MSDTYHHGNLRRAILERATAIITEQGVEALSLRAVAAELNVSHAAPRHHFSSKKALITAIAADGFTELADRIEQARDDGFLGAGLAYVAFAAAQPAAFEVMFTPTLLDTEDPQLAQAASRSLELLRTGASRHNGEGDATALAGWAMAHGLAALLRSGGLVQTGFLSESEDPLVVAESALRMLVGPTVEH
ncbi:TetR/AcrR family transcriptional regulator [Tessaracoccus lubricantis]|uniref:TetR/AcrR family transcriptional regulator n=1 Tax=Tessaracoccus lubricantis TaxID=545543 RepID=A0ABP9FPM5_9ACTN